MRQTEENDRGTYSCVFRNSQGGSESRSVVGQFRRAVTIAAPPPEYNVTVGHSVTLSCEARHQNQIQWQNSNRIAISSSSDGRVQVQGTNLYFREVRLEDNGTYYCLASNEISNDEITVHLVVLGEYERTEKVVINRTWGHWGCLYCRGAFIIGVPLLLGCLYQIRQMCMCVPDLTHRRKGEWSGHETTAKRTPSN